MANTINEPLTGRKQVNYLLPFTLKELRNIHTHYELHAQLDQFLIYGLYPEVFLLKSATEKQKLLLELSESYIFKDVLMLSNLKYTLKIRELLRLLAFQVGAEVSVPELCNILQINRQTVERYIDLLEKAFVIFRLNAYSRNLRNEIGKKEKIYFYDNGIRNALTGGFDMVSKRQDMGALWENFIIAERRKNNLHAGIPSNYYFWRTYDGAEVDYIEEQNQQLLAFEIKYKSKKIRRNQTFEDTYLASVNLVNRDNYTEWV